MPCSCSVYLKYEPIQDTACYIYVQNIECIVYTHNGFSNALLDHRKPFVYTITMCTQTESINLLFLDADFHDVAPVYYWSGVSRSGSITGQ